MRIHHLDELTLKNVIIRDLANDTIIHASEVTAHISPLRLMKGEIQINTLLFDSPVIKLNRASEEAPLNIQFILNSIGRKEQRNRNNVSLRINQMLIYDGTFHYDVHNAPNSENGAIDPKHIAVNEFECNISLKKFHRDTLDVQVRSIKGHEKSGFRLNRFRARINATSSSLNAKGIEIELPGSEFSSKEICILFNNGKPAFRGEIEGHFVTAADFAAFGTPHLHRIPPAAFSLAGSGDSASAAARLTIATLSGDFGLKARSTVHHPYDNRRTANIDIDKCHFGKHTTSLLQSFLGDSTAQIADLLGNTTFAGNAAVSENSIKGNFNASTACGDITAEINAERNGKYSLQFTGTDIDLNSISGNQHFASCDINASANGDAGQPDMPIFFSGTITELVAGKHKYSPIVYSGKYSPEGIIASAAINDAGLEAALSLEYSRGKEQKIDTEIIVDTFIPHKLGLNDKPADFFSFNIDGELNIESNGKSLINAKISNFTFDNGEYRELVRNFHICDNNSAEQRLIVVSSDFLNGSIIGNYSYKSIIDNFAKLAARHMPSLSSHFAETEEECDYVFKFNINNSRLISRLLNMPVTINGASEASGSCNSRKGLFRFGTRLNNVEIGNSRFNTITLDGISGSREFTVNIQAQKPAANSDMLIGMQCTMLNDTIKNNIYWNNNRSTNRMQGSLRTDAMFGRNANGLLTMNARILPDSIVHNDSVWYLSAGTVTGDAGRINIRKVNLYNSTQHLMIDGCAGTEPEDSLSISANNLEISTILDLINFRTLRIAGCATGKAYITSALTAPDFSGELDIDSLKIEHHYMGNSSIKLGWSDKWKSILLDSSIENPGKGISKVSGFLSQAHDTICLKIDANSLNLGFLNNKLKKYVTDINGTGSGKASILGSWRKLDLTGAISLNTSARVNATNTTYFFLGDTLRLNPGEILFNTLPIKDRKGNRGIINGAITHKNLSQWECRLKATANNLLVYDTHSFSTLPFYGTVFATGTVDLTSDSKGMFLKAELRSEPASRFIYNSSDASGVRDNSYVTFIDSSKKNTYRRQKSEKTKKSSNTNSSFDSKLNLDFMLDMKETMQLKVYTNITSDDYIDLYGNGFLHAVYDEKEGFSMKGNLDLTRGTYKFTVQNIFPKEFNITKGSTLTFNGNPFDAALNLKTKYLVPSASLSDLTTETSKRKTVKVNCLMDITGTLKNPTLSFDLELPEGSEEERELLASVASTTEQKNMQFIYLLGIGKFYTYDNNSQAGESQTSTAMESLISNTLSGQLNNMLGQIIDNGNWDISGNFSTSERGWNSMEVEGMLEGRLLNNRLLINGNFGYRENPAANRNFIGDFEIQWLLNKSGTVSLKAYSKTNDRYFSKTNMTTQGAGIMLRHDFNSWLWWRGSEENKGKEKR